MIIVWAAYPDNGMEGYDVGSVVNWISSEAAAPPSAAISAMNVMKLVGGGVL